MHAGSYRLCATSFARPHARLVSAIYFLCSAIVDKYENDWLNEFLSGGQKYLFYLYLYIYNCLFFTVPESMLHTALVYLSCLETGTEECSVCTDFSINRARESSHILFSK